MDGFRETRWIGLLAATTLGLAAAAQPSLAKAAPNLADQPLGEAKAPAAQSACASSVVVTQSEVVVVAKRQCSASIVIADGQVVVTASRTPGAGATPTIETTAGAREPISLADGGSLVRTSQKP
jgi:hypothetical protein